MASQGMLFILELSQISGEKFDASWFKSLSWSQVVNLWPFLFSLIEFYFPLRFVWPAGGLGHGRSPVVRGCDHCETPLAGSLHTGASIHGDWFFSQCNSDCLFQETVFFFFSFWSTASLLTPEDFLSLFTDFNNHVSFSKQKEHKKVKIVFSINYLVLILYTIGVKTQEIWEQLMLLYVIFLWMSFMGCKSQWIVLQSLLNIISEPKCFFLFWWE